MIVLVLLLILVVAGIIKYILHMWRMESYVTNLQSIAPFYPFFGNSLQLVGKSASEAFCETMNLIKVHDTPCKMYLGPILSIISDRPDDCKAVFMSQCDKPYIYTFLDTSNDEDNLLTSACKFVIRVKTFI